MVNFALVIYFLSGIFYTMEYFNSLQFPMLFFSVVIIFLNSITDIFNIRVSLNIVEKIYLLFSISLLFSAVFNFSSHMIVSAIGMLSLWFVFSQWLPKTKKYFCTINNVYSFILIPCLCIIFFSFVTYGFSLRSYKGPFVTSNGYGAMSVTALAVCLSLNLSYEKVDKKKIMLLMLSLFFLFCTFISTCRGAIITSIGMICFFIFFALHGKNAKKIVFGVYVTIIILITGCFFIYNSSGVLNTVIQNISNKFVKKSGDTFDGRFDKWMFVFERIKFWGNGEVADFGAHNSFFSILDQYGIIPFISLVLFSLIGLWYSFKIALNTRMRHKLKFLPFYSFFAFILLSITESMMLKTIMLQTVFCLPLFSYSFWNCVGNYKKQ